MDEEILKSFWIKENDESAESKKPHQETKQKHREPFSQYTQGKYQL